MTDGRPIVAALLAAVLALAPAPAQAARSPEADRLYEDAKAALKAGDAEAALATFHRLLGLVEGDERETWQMLLGVALAHERLGQLPGAIAAYQAFLDRSEAHPSVLDDDWRARRDLTAKKLQRLEQQVLLDHGLVSVSTRPAGATLLVNGQPVGVGGSARTPHALYLPAGKHTLRLELDGHDPVELEVHAVAGLREPFAVTLPRHAAPAEVLDPAPTADAPEPSPTWPAWVLIGGGGALVVGGAVSMGLALVDQNEQFALDPSLGKEPFEYEHAQLTRSMDLKWGLGWALAGVGAAAAVGGAVWLVLGADDEPAEALWHVTPTRDGAVAGAAWTF